VILPTDLLRTAAALLKFFKFCKSFLIKPYLCHWFCKKTADKGLKEEQEEVLDGEGSDLRGANFWVGEKSSMIHLGFPGLEKIHFKGIWEQ
jgi:hypothetical protein